MRDISSEIRFKTARSGGKGGQHVNKVETMAEGFWMIKDSTQFATEEKQILIEKLSSKINNEGELFVKSQVGRSQLGNKNMVIKKMNLLIQKALTKKKPRIATKPSKASKEKRIESKKIISEKKTKRKRITL